MKTTIGQQDSVKIQLTLSTHTPTKKPDFITRITLFSPKQIAIYNKPEFSDIDADYGTIKFTLERLDSNCYSLVYVTTDYLFNPKFDTTKKTLHKDSVSYEYNLTNLYYFGQRCYRVKVRYYYFVDGQSKYVESAWVYFCVPIRQPLIQNTISN